MEPALEYNSSMIPERVCSAVLQKRGNAVLEKKKRLEKRKEEAFREISRLVKAFQQIDPFLGRIILFGSLAEDTVSSEQFDIDLAFEGREYYRCAAETLGSPFKIDLVDYRICAPHIKNEIDTKGTIVYDPRS
jgi:predicted nucleotidyltransferase